MDKNQHSIWSGEGWGVGQCSSFSKKMKCPNTFVQHCRFKVWQATEKGKIVKSGKDIVSLTEMMFGQVQSHTPGLCSYCTGLAKQATLKNPEVKYQGIWWAISFWKLGIHSLTGSLIFSVFKSDVSKVAHFPTACQLGKRRWIRGCFILIKAWGQVNSKHGTWYRIRVISQFYLGCRSRLFHLEFATPCWRGPRRAKQLSTVATLLHRFYSCWCLAKPFFHVVSALLYCLWSRFVTF